MRTLTVSAVFFSFVFSILSLLDNMFGEIYDGKIIKEIE